MRLYLNATGFFAVVIAITASTNTVSAEPRQKQVVSSGSKAAVATRPRARITVERRSFLDAGTEVLPGEHRITDYAFPPGYSPIAEALGPGKDYRRQPLLDPWDFPGYSNVWWRRY
ncbi:MAG TPA: hypothetical protein VH684_05250 [Xanthobacteraceae bacterium]|jgi:hypothetical protein